MPLKLRRVALIVVVVLLVILVGSCVFMYTVGGFFSKLKGPITDVKVPATLTAGGQSYVLAINDSYLNRSAAKAGFRTFTPRIGYDPAAYGNNIDQMMDVGAVDQYTWFEYDDGTGQPAVGGFLAKSGSPFVVDAGLTSLSVMLGASMGFINNPDLNQGGAQNLTRLGSTSIASADLYHFTANYVGSTRGCYFLIGKDSNVYVAVYSFESLNTTEDAARQAVEWIDNATASK